jgi:hypothetical protein
MSMPAGSRPPAPDEIDDVRTRVHAIDGDGESLCGTAGDIEQIDHHFWSEVPASRRCPVCDALAG